MLNEHAAAYIKDENSKNLWMDGILCAATHPAQKQIYLQGSKPKNIFWICH